MGPSNGIGNSVTVKGVVLNVSKGQRVVRVSLPTTVRDLSFDVRDLSHDGTGVQEAISFSVPTVVTNKSFAAPATNHGDLSQTGSVGSGVELYRSNLGITPGVNPNGGSNGYYYDMKVEIAGPIDSFDVTFGCRSSSTSANFACVQLTDFTFCA